MKIMIDISDPILNQARKLAERQETTVEALLELALRQIIAEQRQAGGFRLRAASFRGNGLKPGLQNAPWRRLRRLVYKARVG